MPLLLLDTESDISVQIDLPDDRKIALSRQLSRSQKSGYRDGFKELVANAVVQAMTTRLDWDLLPPTEPQKSFAVSISEGLGIDIPREALYFRGAMAEFLNVYAERLKVLQTLRATVKATPFSPGDLKMTGTDAGDASFGSTKGSSESG